jgi:hypothetical protein
MTAGSVSATPELANVAMLPHGSLVARAGVPGRPADAHATDAVVVDGSIVMDFEADERLVESVGFSGVHCPRCEDPRGADEGVVLQVQGRQFPSGLVDRWVCVMPTTADDVDIARFTDLISLDEARLGADGARRLGQALCEVADAMDELGCHDRREDRRYDRKRKPPKVSQRPNQPANREAHDE